MLRIENTLIPVALFSRLFPIVHCATLNTLNETLSDPFIRVPIDFAIVCAICKRMYDRRYEEESNLEDEDEKCTCEEEDGKDS